MIENIFFWGGGGGWLAENKTNQCIQVKKLKIPRLC